MRINRYTQFINENLYYKGDFDSIITSIADTDIIASLLVYLNYSGAYPDDTDVNFINLGNEINTFRYHPKRTRSINPHDPNSWDGPSVEVRIGRLIKKIISNIDKNNISFEYKGKSVVSTESGNYRNTVTAFSFSGGLTGLDFYEKWKNSSFHMSYTNDEKSIEKCNIDIKINDKSYNSYIVSYNDRSHLAQDNSRVYFRLSISDDLGIGDKNVAGNWGNFNSIDLASKNVFDVEFKLDPKFGGKFIHEINDSDIEKFVNKVVSEVKFLRAPEDSKIEEVKGEEIKKWYNQSNYNSDKGQLGSSCMGDSECQRYFGLYTENPDQVSLLILKNKEDKLVGRALLWKLDSGKYFMDRVYCATEYDENVFIKHAKENGYYYRSNGSNKDIKYYLNGSKIEKPEDLFLTLDLVDLPYYPYLDTLKNLFINSGVLHSDDSLDYDRELRDVEGKWTEYWE